MRELEQGFKILPSKNKQVTKNFPLHIEKGFTEWAQLKGRDKKCAKGNKLAHLKGRARATHTLSLGWTKATSICLPNKSHQSLPNIGSFTMHSKKEGENVLAFNYRS